MSNDTQNSRSAPVVSVEKIKAVMEKSASDVIGRAHATYEDLKALVAEAEVPVEAKDAA